MLPFSSSGKQSRPCRWIGLGRPGETGDGVGNHYSLWLGWLGFREIPSGVGYHNLRRIASPPPATMATGLASSLGLPSSLLSLTLNK
jgi:hypothetical protein